MGGYRNAHRDPRLTTYHVGVGRPRSDQEAREFAQAVLGLVSLVVWFGLSFGVAIAMQLTYSNNRTIMMIGGVALVIAALPWLGYHRLVKWAREHPRS
jgi:hypothetical protein